MPEGISLNTQSNFDRFFDLNNYTKDHKDIETIFMEISEASRDISHQMRLNFIQTRMFNQDGQFLVTQDKIKEYFKKFGVTIESVGTLLAVGGAVFGGQLGSVLTTLGSQGFATASNFYKERTRANIEGYDFHASRLATLVSELFQEIQSYKRNEEQDSSLMDRVTAGIHRIFELMISSSS